MQGVGRDIHSCLLLIAVPRPWSIVARAARAASSSPLPNKGGLIGWVDGWFGIGIKE